MLRCIASAIAALCLFAVFTARATDHITVEIGPNTTIGAGFGQLTPAVQDLRVTMQWESGLNLWPPSSVDMTGMTTWYYETLGSTTATYKAVNATEDKLGWVKFDGRLYEQSPYESDPFLVHVGNVLWPCKECPSCESPYCSLTEEGELEICVPRSVPVRIMVHHGLPGTLTILRGTSDLQVLDEELEPFVEANLSGSGVTAVDVVLKADVDFVGEVTLTARFLQDGAELDSQDVLVVNVVDYHECVDILNPPFAAEPLQ
jgi:hypothetical protein